MAREDEEIAALQAARKGTALGSQASGEFDKDLYGGGPKGYAREIVDEAPDDDAPMGAGASHPATRANKAVDDEPEDFDPFAEHRAASGRQAIAERESEYQKRGRALQRLSPERGDVYGDATPARSYKDVMQSQTVWNSTSMCAYATVSTQALRSCFENSTRAIDSSKNQPNRLRFDRAREF